MSLEKEKFEAAAGQEPEIGIRAEVLAVDKDDKENAPNAGDSLVSQEDLTEEPGIVPLTEEERRGLDASWRVQASSSAIEESERTINDIKTRIRFMSGDNKKRAEADLAQAERLKKIKTEHIMEDVYFLPVAVEFAQGLKESDYDTFMRFEVLGKKDRQEDKDRDAGTDVLNRVAAFVRDLTGQLIIPKDLAMKIAEKMMLEKKKEAKLLPKEEDGILSWSVPPEEQPRAATAETSMTLYRSRNGLGYIEFDPEEELVKIDRFSPDEMGSTTPEERILIKKERLERYKERLAEQKLGIAEINAELEWKIMVDKEINRDALLQHVMERAERYLLSEPQIEKYKLVIDRIIKKDTTAADVLKNKERETDGEIFKKLFGFEPAGRIKIEKEPACLFITASDERDLAALYKGISTDELSDEDIKKVASFNGFANVRTKIKGSAGFVAVERETTDLAQMSRTKKHEIRHVVHGALFRIEDIGVYPIKYGTGDKEKRADLEYSMKDDAETHLFSAKDEILAFVRGGTDPDAFQRILLQRKENGGIYDYFAEHEQEYMDKSNDPKDAMAKLEDQRKAYEDRVKECVEVVKNLRLFGLSPGEIIATLEAEHPARWKRTFDMLRQTPQFDKKRQERQRWLDIELESTRKKIGESTYALALFQEHPEEWIKTFCSKDRQKYLNGCSEDGRQQEVEGMLHGEKIKHENLEKKLERLKKEKETLGNL